MLGLLVLLVNIFQARNILLGLEEVMVKRFIQSAMLIKSGYWGPKHADLFVKDLILWLFSIG